MSAKEKQLTEQGIAHQRKAAELRVRHNINAAHLDPPGEDADSKRLVELNAEIPQLEESIRHSRAAPGTSADEFALRKLLTERERLEPLVSNYATRFANWEAIQDEKRLAEECFQKRDELRKKREAAAIAAVLKAK